MQARHSRLTSHHLWPYLVPLRDMGIQKNHWGQLQFSCHLSLAQLAHRCLSITGWSFLTECFKVKAGAGEDKAVVPGRSTASELCACQQFLSLLGFYSALEILLPEALQVTHTLAALTSRVTQETCCQTWFNQSWREVCLKDRHHYTPQGFLTLWEKAMLWRACRKESSHSNWCSRAHQ